MAEHGGKAPPPKKGGEKKSGGGFWSFLGDVLSKVSVDVNPGKPGRPGAASRNPTDPAQRMEPVHEERKEAYEETIYRKTEGADGTAPAVRVDRDRQAIARSLDARMGSQGEASVPKGGGSPLSSDVRAKMEPRLGSDLSGVRVHTSGESAAAAEGLSAKAFTVGNDVHFASGNYQPGTKEGDRLIAHELTHVVQGQRAGVQRKADDGGGEGHEGGEAGVSHPDEPAEKEADSVADHVAEGLHGGEEQGGSAEHAAGAPGSDEKKKDGEASGARGVQGDKKDQAAAGADGKAGGGAAKGDKNGADKADGDKSSGGAGKGAASKDGANKDAAGGSGGAVSSSSSASAGDQKAAAAGAAPSSSSSTSAAGAGAPPGGDHQAAGAGAAGAGGAPAAAPAGGAGAAAGGAQAVQQQAPPVARKRRDDAMPITAPYSGRKIHRVPRPAGGAAPRPAGGAAAPGPAGAAAPRPAGGAAAPRPAGGAAAPRPPGAPPGAAGPTTGAAAPAPPPPPTALGGPSGPDISDPSVELGIAMTELSGAQSFGPGGDPAAVAQQVQAKGGRQDGTTLILPAIPTASVGSAASVEAAANAIMAATGIQKVNVTKEGDDVRFTPQLNPPGPSLKAQNKAWPTIAGKSGWFAVGDLGGLKNAAAYLRHWKDAPASDPRKLLADGRGRFRKLADGPYVENAEDKKDLEAAVQDRMRTASDAWKKDLDDPEQMLSDKKTAGPTVPKDKILKTFVPTAAFSFAEGKAKEALLQQLPTMAGSGAAYTPVTKTVAENAIKEGGPHQRAILLEGGQKVASEAKTHALAQVTHPNLVAQVNTINYDANTDTFGVVRVPRQTVIEGHHLYAPREIKREPPAPSCFPDGTYKITYKGYRDAEFTVTVGKNGMPKTVQGHKVTLAAGMPRGVVRDSPGLTGPPPAGAAAPTAGGAPTAAKPPATAGASAATTPAAPGAAATPAAPGAATTPAAPGAATTPALTPDQVLARAHLIGDQFRGSGYKEALNLVTTSEKYNHPIMSTVENRLAGRIANQLPNTETSFDYEVNVEWAEGQDANAMIQDIVSEGAALGLVTLGSAEEADVRAGLQRFMGAVANRKVVKGVKYHATGPKKGGGNFNEDDEVGPDIYFT